MKTKIKNIFNNIKNYLNNDLSDKRWKWFIRFFLILIISIYIGALSIIGVVGFDYVQDKIDNIENSEQVEILDDKNITMQRANSVNDNVISPTGTYDKLYFNTSLTNNELKSIFNNLTYHDTFGYIIYFDNLDATFISISKPDINGNSVINSYGIDTTNMSLINGENFLGVYGTPENPSEYMVWGDFVNPYTIYLDSGINEFDLTELGYGVIPIGQQNNLIKDLISPVPFLFEGNVSENMESSGINTTTIDNFYINNNLTNVAIKETLDNNLGNTTGTSFIIDVPYIYDNDVESIRHFQVNIINTSTSAFIRLENTDGTLVDYWYIYDTLDTADSVYWYGLRPNFIESNLIFTSTNFDNSISISYDGTLETALNFLFSDTNDFSIIEELPPSYEEGYQAGYNAGYSAGTSAGYQNGYNQGKIDGYNEGYQAGSDTTGNNSYNSGFSAGTTNGINIVQTNPNRYGLYTQSDLNNAIASAEGEGLELGMQQVIENPNQYNLYTQEQYDAAINGTSQDFLNPVFSWLEKASRIMSNIFSVELFPGVTLGILVLLPLIFALFFFILKLFFGG